MKTFRTALLAAAALAFACLQPAFAEPLPSDNHWRIALFSASPFPAAVTVDVVDLSDGTQVATDAAATQVQANSVDMAIWKFDLSTVTGYPTDGSFKSYLIIWQQDSDDCQESGTPTECAYESATVGGDAQLDAATGVSTSVVYTTSVTSAQGITSSVIDFYARRGQQVPKWRKIDIAADKDYSTPDSTVYEVFFYTDAQSSPRPLCTVVTATNPASSLPSSTHCGTGS